MYPAVWGKNTGPYLAQPACKGCCCSVNFSMFVEMMIFLAKWLYGIGSGEVGTLSCSLMCIVVACVVERFCRLHLRIAVLMYICCCIPLQ